MKLIHYAGETLLTGDAIADAVLRYAGALAGRESSATIAIPVRLPNGTVATASMLIGPASQLVALPQESDQDEIIDDELLAKIQGEVGRLSQSSPQTETISVIDSDHTRTGAPADWEL